MATTVENRFALLNDDADADDRMKITAAAAKKAAAPAAAASGGAAAAAPRAVPANKAAAAGSAPKRSSSGPKSGGGPGGGSGGGGGGGGAGGGSTGFDGEFRKDSRSRGPPRSGGDRDRDMKKRGDRPPRADRAGGPPGERGERPERSDRGDNDRAPRERKRLYDRHSGTGRPPTENKKGGGGRHNWGNPEEEARKAEEGGEAAAASAAAADAAPADDGTDAAAGAEPRAPAVKERTLDEFLSKRTVLSAPVGRKAGDGEDPKEWMGKATVLKRDKEAAAAPASSGKGGSKKNDSNKAAANLVKFRVASDSDDTGDRRGPKPGAGGSSSRDPKGARKPAGAKAAVPVMDNNNFPSLA